jgi:hypothetical protein
MGEFPPVSITSIPDILDRWRHDVLKEYDWLSNMGVE